MPQVNPRTMPRLEPDRREMQRMMDTVCAAAIEQVARLGTVPAADTTDTAPPRLDEPLPVDGVPLDDLLRLVFEELAPRSVNTAGPGYLGYIPGGGLFHSAAADFISATLNRFVGSESMAPGLVRLEWTVVRWLCDLLGFDAGSGGVLTSGGSMATLTAVVAAREQRVGDALSRGTIYVSSQSHHSVAKATRIAGFPRANVRVVPTDADGAIDLSAAAQAIRRDRAAGMRPALLVATAGTTQTGAIDDLDGAATLAEAEDLWLHVDAAYGGFFALVERGRALLAGIGRAHSITLDPHKGLGLPYGTGAVLVARRRWLTAAFSSPADYLPEPDPDAIDFSEMSPELSRGLRGLRLWLPLKLLGIGPFVEHLDEKLDLARWAADRLSVMPGIELVAPVRLSVVAFRFAPAGADPETLDGLNRRLVQAINARARVFLSGTLLGERYVVRLAILSFRTHRDRIEMALQDIAAACDEVGVDVDR